MPAYVMSRARAATSLFAQRMGISLIEDLEDTHFRYLATRYEEGFQAFYVRDWQKAVFTFISCLDGILKEFCDLHKNCDCKYEKQFPTHRETWDHLMNHYSLRILAGSKEFYNRLEAFFLHRHQIMHGDKNAFFDENIATISLIFLVMVFMVVSRGIENDRKG